MVHQSAGHDQMFIAMESSGLKTIDPAGAAGQLSALRLAAS